jgi:uncharacterized protein
MSPKVGCTCTRSRLATASCVEGSNVWEANQFVELSEGDAPCCGIAVVARERGRLDPGQEALGVDLAREALAAAGTVRRSPAGAPPGLGPVDRRHRRSSSPRPASRDAAEEGDDRCGAPGRRGVHQTVLGDHPLLGLAGERRGPDGEIRPAVADVSSDAEVCTASPEVAPVGERPERHTEVCAHLAWRQKLIKVGRCSHDELGHLWGCDLAGRNDASREGLSTLDLVAVPELAVDADQLAEVCRRYGVSRLDVFGSVSRGEAGPDSDIDVLYELAAGSRLGWNIEDLADELSRLLGRRVDLVSSNALHDRLRDKVLAEARLLYAA